MEKRCLLTMLSPPPRARAKWKNRLKFEKGGCSFSCFQEPHFTWQVASEGFSGHPCVWKRKSPNKERWIDLPTAWPSGRAKIGDGSTQRVLLSALWDAIKHPSSQERKENSLSPATLLCPQLWVSKKSLQPQQAIFLMEERYFMASGPHPRL